VKLVQNRRHSKRLKGKRIQIVDMNGIEPSKTLTVHDASVQEIYDDLKFFFTVKSSKSGAEAIVWLKNM